MEFVIILIGIVVLYPTIRILIDRRNHKIKRTFYPKPTNDYLKITEVPGTGKVIIE